MFNFWGAYHRTKASPVGEAVNAKNAALTEEDNFNNSQSLLKSRIFCIGFFALYRRIRATSPMRRTHPLRQPLADTSPNSMGEFAPKGKARSLICARLFNAKVWL